MSAVIETGEASFIAGLLRCGCDPQLRNGVVVFSVIPIGGQHAGKPIDTGISTDELEGWPSVPPHWVHLPASVSIGNSNTKPSTISGWLKHSRKIRNWGNAQEPAQAWIAHVRAVLEDS